MGSKDKPDKERCDCPFCDAEMPTPPPPYCKPCQVTILHCTKCGKPLPRGESTCPSCGAQIGRES